MGFSSFYHLQTRWNITVLSQLNRAKQRIKRRPYVQIESRELAPTHYWAKMCVVNFSILDFIQIRFYELIYFKYLTSQTLDGIQMQFHFVFFVIPHVSSEMGGTEYIFMGMEMNGPEYLVCLMIDLTMWDPLAHE